ncbi:unnamed protein product [Amoebophrya sp. A25]|nr:unnamed protein product [Amoebophrya sp. A25]|eukprot:GSA25T00016001001.1
MSEYIERAKGCDPEDIKTKLQQFESTATNARSLPQVVNDLTELASSSFPRTSPNYHKVQNLLKEFSQGMKGTTWADYSGDAMVVAAASQDLAAGFTPIDVRV